MGTNYYLERTCPISDSVTERLHIGKSSYGWKFLFNSNNGVNKSFSDWRAILELRSNQIVDEYGKRISLYEFYTIIHEKQSHKDHGIHAIVDDEGFNISIYTEFS